MVRQRAFSARISELMLKYTKQQLTSAEVIAELIEMAREVAAEANRGKAFSPPLSEDELAFYDAVSQNESAVELQGEDVLAQIARDLVAVMRRDVKTDWTVRDDVRAKLRHRRDVLVEPAPRGIGQLAQRLSGRESLGAALHGPLAGHCGSWLDIDLFRRAAIEQPSDHSGR